MRFHPSLKLIAIVIAALAPHANKIAGAIIKVIESLAGIVKVERFKDRLAEYETGQHEIIQGDFSSKDDESSNIGGQ